jgi:hypothetical protein
MFRLGSPLLVSLARPPREVPFTTALALRLNETMVQVGSAVLAVFGCAAIFSLADADVASLWRYRGELERVEARVTAVEDTGKHEIIGVRKGRRRPILRFTFDFEHAGARHTQSSYSIQRRVDPGVSASVEFPRDRPHYARIVGMRSDVFGADGLFSLFGPAMGVFVVGWGLVRSGRAVTLLRTGSLAAGVIQPEPSRGERKERLWDGYVPVVFEVEPGRTVRHTFTSQHPFSYPVGRTVHLLFDPRRPERCRPMEDLAISVSVDARGQIVPVGLAPAARGMAIPALSLAAIVVLAVVV